MRRVVVTGMGAVTPLGGRRESSWSRLLAGESGIRRIAEFDTSDLRVHIGGLVPLIRRGGDVNVDDFIAPREQRRIAPFVHYAIMAAREAVEDAGYKAQTPDQQYRSGVLIGSGIGGLNEVCEAAVLVEVDRQARKLSPFFIPSILINIAAGYVSIEHGFKGPNHSVVTACSTGTHAIGDAYRIIERDEADVMIAGGCEAAVCRLGIAGFAALRALSTGYQDTPAVASRPWDKGRDGFVMSEGAGVLVLEAYDHAKARGAKIYGEIVGYGLSGDAFHITAPAEDGDGGYRAMKAALKSAALEPSALDYINAHGTSTPKGDVLELQAIRRLFDDRIAGVSISSTKSSIGHLLGAAGAVEAVFCLLALRDQVMPATLNLLSPAPEAEGFDLVPLVPKKKKLKTVMSNSFGFGGTNSSLVMRALEE